MDHLKLTYNKLAVDDIVELVSSPSCGAVSMFCGTTRDNFDGKTVVELEYEAYESMALKVMKEVCVEMRQNWPSIENIAIYHRLGLVPVKQSSIIIAVSSPHREAALLSTQYCIENVKGRIPIWKKEKYGKDDETAPAWKENKECPWSSNNQFVLKTERAACNEMSSNETKSIQPETEDDDLVQIKASNSEILRRINRFMERKREMLNMTNVLDFCVPNTSNIDLHTETNSCARIDAVLTRRKDSKSHLRVRRVHNVQGPLTMHSMEVNSISNNDGISERLANAEQHLLLNKPIPTDIYERIKRIEDRILELESLSPEYCQFWKHLPSMPLPPLQRLLSTSQNLKRKRDSDSLVDIEKRIEHLQREALE
ncbi:molybdopterin synthase catalytic subunit [Chrysoperla carnea]|uniref:molybdopterin synthase catalytic subunit n=1 Tax=Chrysoperla carnea TaxID=189513 RepID=UPI001D080656|nr:molybdopterin synthase catalytic subunit [Chrysoperla carnea]